MVGVPLAVAVGEIEPHDGEAHATAQVTPWAEESPVTVAVNWTVVPTATDAGVGEIETAIPEPPAPGTVIVAEADLELAATEVAVTATVKVLAGELSGAV